MSTKILIVEDSPTELQLVTAALKGHGFELVIARDGEEATAKALAEQPDLILLDVVLPKKNGYQVCRHLKSDPQTRQIKVLMLTSKSQDVDRFWGLRQGADGYLTKPFNTEELLSQIGALV